MKKFTTPLFAALIGFSSFASAATPIEIFGDETAITSSGQQYGIAPEAAVVFTVDDYKSSNGISFTLDVAGDYSYTGAQLPYFEGLTFKIDNFTLAEWSKQTENFEGLESPFYSKDYNYFSFAKTFEADTVIGSSTFGAIWESAAADGEINITWFNSNEVNDLTDPNQSNLYDYVKYDFSVSAVPEPSTYALMLAGLGLVGFMAKRRRKA